MPPITPVANAPSIAYHSLFIDFCLSRPSRNDIPTQPMISLSSSRYYWYSGSRARWWAFYAQIFSDCSLLVMKVSMNIWFSARFLSCLSD